MFSIFSQSITSKRVARISPLSRLLKLGQLFAYYTTKRPEPQFRRCKRYLSICFPFCCRLGYRLGLVWFGLVICVIIEYSINLVSITLYSLDKMNYQKNELPLNATVEIRCVPLCLIINN